MMVASDANYHQLLPDEEESSGRDSFFNSVVDYGFSHSNCQFRFCLPGQNETDEYKQQILGFFKNEPCLYNHRIFGHAAAFFDAMKHPDDDELTGPGANVSKADNNLTARSKVRTGRRYSNLTGIDGKTARLPEVEFESSKEKRLTYQLVFQTLKCEILIYMTHFYLWSKMYSPVNVECLHQTSDSKFQISTETKLICANYRHGRHNYIFDEV